jgi:hypothetical protein
MRALGTIPIFYHKSPLFTLFTYSPSGVKANSAFRKKLAHFGEFSAENARSVA